MQLQGLIYFVVYFVAATSAVQVQRSDDVNRLDALETLVQRQAATIQQQEATIQSLQAKQSVLDTTYQHLQTMVHQQDVIIQQQGVTISSLQTSLQQITSHQGVSVGFYADFGVKPYHEVSIPLSSPVIFTHVLTNEGNGYDRSNGFFRAPVSGLYTFQLHFMGGNHNNRTDISIMTEVNNSSIAVAFAEGNDADKNDQGSCTAVIYLNNGERISAQFTFGLPKIWGSRLTSFSGFIIHAD